jgi:hypothetical protein
MNYRMLTFLLIPFFALSLLKADDILPKYLIFQSGTNYSHIRDEGTSPVRYQGGGINTGLSFFSEKKYGLWGINAHMSYNAGFSRDQHLLHHIETVFSGYYLHDIPLSAPAGLSFRVGGNLRSSLAFSYNDAYQNAAFNLDIFNALLLRTHLQYAFNIAEKEQKFLFMNFRRPSRDYILTASFDMPLLLLNMRPEFPYVVNGALNGTEMLSRHIFFGGFRLQSRIGLAHFLPNGNMLELAYVWDMFSTGKRDIYLLEKASHQLQCVFYFRLN